MKTEEDEAFDDLARKQGAWGGGFKAKQAMAADKLQEPEREALKLALEALESGVKTTSNRISWTEYDTCLMNDAITAIKAALAQPAQEPLAWMCSAFDGEPCEQTNHDECGNPIPLYTTPPQPAQPAQRPWVGLTDEDIEGCLHHVDDEAVIGLSDFARAVEQLLKEKNA
jgi:hypothetical protein